MWPPAASFFVLAQALHEPNPASHLIWWVAGVAFALLGLIALLEIVDWLGGQFGGPGRAAGGRRQWRLEEPDSTLRRRFFRRLRPRSRLWP